MGDAAILVDIAEMVHTLKNMADNATVSKRLRLGDGSVLVLSIESLDTFNARIRATEARGMGSTDPRSTWDVAGEDNNK